VRVQINTNRKLIHAVCNVDTVANVSDESRDRLTYSAKLDGISASLWDCTDIPKSLQFVLFESDGKSLSPLCGASLTAGIGALENSSGASTK